ncbi:hypothetical protein M885DRAFT_624808 [Pelagophyceae sp. CCMP2097]|nr:hypothetical protein M885DRAFT_624808 [Pelagophyceae sp. CCMP2097]
MHRGPAPLTAPPPEPPMRCAVVTTTCVARFSVLKAGAPRKGTNRQLAAEAAAPGLGLLCWWARYHVALGVAKMYLYIHDTAAAVGAANALRDAAAAALLRAGVDPSVVVVLPALLPRDAHDAHGSCGRPTVDVVAMQQRDVQDAILRARHDGLQWIFHFDDDELLHVVDGRRGARALSGALRATPPGAFNLRLDNLEVQKTRGKTDSAYNFFEEEHLFKLRVALHADGSRVAAHHDARFYANGGNPATGGGGLTAPFLSYWNGKSAGRVSEAGLRPCGVHYFAASRGDAAVRGAQHRSEALLLLHYPFCHFDTWRHKFNILDAAQASDWGHYKEARLGIVAAVEANDAAAIAALYERTVLLGGEEDGADADALAVFIPGAASPAQAWRSGYYTEVTPESPAGGAATSDGPAESPAAASAALGRVWRLVSAAAKTAKGVDAPAPPSFLYCVAAKGMWLVGSSPGSTAGAAVAYDCACEPSAIEAPWSVYDGAAWTHAAGMAVANVRTARRGRRFAVIDAGGVLRNERHARGPPVDGGRLPACSSLKALEACPGGLLKDACFGGGGCGGDATSREQRPHVTDHARLAACVCASLSAHGPYRVAFWAAAATAARREAPSALARAAALRALAAGAAAMGAPAVAAGLVAERLAGDARRGDRLVDVRRALAAAAAAELEALGAGGDAVYLALPGLGGAQAWRAGLYTAVAENGGGAAGCKSLYRRVRGKSRIVEAESYLFALPARGMWLVGSTPGSTTGGLVAYDDAAKPQDVTVLWHVFDGEKWITTPRVSVTLARQPPPDDGARRDLDL